MSNKHYSFKNIRWLISLFSLLLSLSSSATETPLTLEEAWVQQATQSPEKIFIQPTVTQEEMMLGLLEVLKNLTDKAEMTPKNIEKWFGKPFRTYKNAPQEYYISGNATKDWNISLLFNDYYRNRQPYIRLSLIKVDRTLINRPDFTEVCTIDVNKFDQIIKQLDYKGGGELRQRLGHSREYQRNNIHVEIMYSGESNKNIRHECIEHVKIRTTEKRSML